MCYDTIPAEVSRYQVVSRYHAILIHNSDLQNKENCQKCADINENRPNCPQNPFLMRKNNWLFEKLKNSHEATD